MASWEKLERQLERILFRPPGRRSRCALSPLRYVGPEQDVDAGFPGPRIPCRNGGSIVFWEAEEGEDDRRNDVLRPEGEGLKIALLVTGLPRADGLRPISAGFRQRIRIARLWELEEGEETDGSGHEDFNFWYLEKWLPRAEYTAYILPPKDADTGRLRHGMAEISLALGDCVAREVDFIISSIFPGSFQLLEEEKLIEKKIVSFWPTGNWERGSGRERGFLAPVDNPCSVFAAQCHQKQFLGICWPWFSRPYFARFDAEKGLPHFWTPGLASAAGAVGSSYSTVPIAVIWIQFHCIYKFLERWGAISPLPADRDSDHVHYIRRQFRDSRQQQRTSAADEHIEFANLHRALENFIADKIEDRKSGEYLRVFYRPARAARGRGWRVAVDLSCLALCLLLTWGAAARFVDLWLEAAPLLDLFTFEGWTYGTAFLTPERVLPIKWPLAALGSIGALGSLVRLVSGLRRRREGR